MIAGPLAWAFHDTVTTSVQGSAPVGPGGWWAWPGSVLLGVMAGALVAGYLAPRGSGRLLLGTACTSCALLPAASVLGAFLLLDSVPSAGGMLTAVGLLLLALLRRRATAVAACAAPGPGPSGPRLPPGA